MEYQIQALLAVAVFFASFITWFVWHGGLEPGPLATWVSGFASTSAVVVALWGQWRVQKQRLEDQSEKLSAPAYQLIIKSSILLQMVKSAHETIRDGTSINKMETEKEKLQFFDLDPIRNLSTLDPIKLNESEANLFARGGALPELQRVNRALEGLRLLIITSVEHDKIQRNMLEHSKRTDAENADSMRVTWDIEIPRVRHLMISNSQTVALMHRLSKEALEDAIDAHSAIATVTSRYVGKSDFADRFLEAAKSEAKLEMPKMVTEEPAKD